MKDRVDFNITNNGISVGANVTRDYFDERVLPLITTLLVELAPSQKGRSAARRAARPEPKPGRAGAQPAKAAAPQRPAVIAAPDAARAAAISSYSHKPARKPSGTHILA